MGPPPNEEVYRDGEARGVQRLVRGSACLPPPRLRAQPAGKRGFLLQRNKMSRRLLPHSFENRLAPENRELSARTWDGGATPCDTIAVRNPIIGGVHGELEKSRGRGLHWSSDDPVHEEKIPGRRARDRRWTGFAGLGISGEVREGAPLAT